MDTPTDRPAPRFRMEHHRPRNAVAVLGYSFVLTLIIAFVIQKTIGFRVSADAEATGIDEAEHAESGYEFSSPRRGGGSSLDRTADMLAHKVSANREG